MDREFVVVPYGNDVSGRESKYIQQAKKAFPGIRLMAFGENALSLSKLTTEIMRKLKDENFIANFKQETRHQNYQNRCLLVTRLSPQ